MNKKIAIFIFAGIFALLLFIAGYLMLPNNKVITAYPGKITELVIGGDIISVSNPPIFESNEVLLPFDIVKKYFDETIFWDNKLKKVIITTKDKVIRMNTDNVTAYVNDKPVKLNMAVNMVGDTVYIPMIDSLRDIYMIDISFNKENNLVVVDYRNNIKKMAEVIKKEAAVRDGMSIKNPIIKRVKQGDSLWAFDEFEKWYKVRTEDGIVGYIQKKFIKITSLTSAIYTQEDSEAETPAAKIVKGKLNLVWEQIESRTPDMKKVGKIKNLDILSPTWFRVINDKGNVESKVDIKYIEWAKVNGYQVWALFSNNFDPKITSKILNDSLLRENVIRQIVVYAKLYKLDGINIDFENLYLKDKNMFSQFVRELSPCLREQGIVVSVDVGVPGGSDNYSKCYDRKALAKSVDYVMVMTYDQHWRTSPVSGSVAQYSWVENKLKETLKEVPSSKLLLGLPFYIREWKEEKNVDGSIKVTQNAVLSMNGAKQRIKDNNAAVQWDEQSGQFYAEYKKGNNVYKMWLEDENSINLKSSLVHKYELAGVASWKRGFESEEIWETLGCNLKQNTSYFEWAKVNNSRQYKFQ